MKRFLLACIALAFALPAVVCRAQTSDDLLSATVTVPFGMVEKWGPDSEHELNAARALKLAHAFEANRDPLFASATLGIFRAYAGQYKAFCAAFHKGRMTGCVFEQLLDEANWFTDLAEAYDALARAGAVPDADRALIWDGFFSPAAEVLLAGDMPNNHQWWYSTAIGSIGYAAGRKELITAAVDGPRGYKRLISKHVNDDGLLFEASILYHYYSLRAFTRLADIATLHGDDLYNISVDDGTPADGKNGKKSPKLMFDALVYFPFQNAVMPAIKDSGAPSRGFEVEFRDLTVAYEKHYKDPVRLAMMRRQLQILAAARARKKTPTPVNAGDSTFALNGRTSLGSSLYPSTGFAIMRADPADINAPAVNMTYGPYGGGHGHPDRLSISFYANREIALPDLGRYEYGNPLQTTWIKQTLSHNTVVVDEKSQAPMNVDGISMWAEQPPDKTGVLRDFVSSPLLKLVRATDDASVRGVTADRTAALYGGMLIDVFRVTSAAGHKYDYVLHPAGELLDSNIALKPSPLPGKKFGYQHLTNVRCGARGPGERWTTVWKTPAGNTLSITAMGDGELACIADAPGNPPSKAMPVLLLRSKNKGAVFASVIVPGKGSGAPKVKLLDAPEVSPPAGRAAFAFSVDAKNYLFVLSPAGGEYSCNAPGGAGIPAVTTDAHFVALSAPAGAKSLDKLSDASIVLYAATRAGALKAPFMRSQKMLDYVEFVWRKGRIYEMRLAAPDKGRLSVEMAFAALTGYTPLKAVMTAYGKKYRLYRPAEIELIPGRSVFTFSGD